MSDAYRRVTIEYEVKLNRNGNAAAMRELTDGAKRANGEAMKAADQRVKHETNALQQLAKQYGYTSAAAMKHEQELSAFQMRQRSQRLRDEQRHQQQILRETQRSTREREREEARAAKERERAAEREAKQQERIDRQQFNARMKVIRDREREEARSTKQAEREAARRAHAEEVAASKQLATNTKLISGLKGMGSASLSAMRSLGMLAAAHSENAEKAMDTVLVFEGIVQGLGGVSKALKSATTFWKAYTAAQKMGEVGKLPIVARMAGAAMGAAPLIGAGAAAAGGIWSSGLLQRGYDWARGKSGHVGSYNDQQGSQYLADASGERKGFWANASYYGGEALSLGIGHRERAEAVAMYKKAKADELAAVNRGNIFDRNQALRWARGDAEAKGQTQRLGAQYDAREAMRQNRPDYLARGAERYGIGQGLIGASRAEALAEERARFLGQPTGVYSIAGSLAARGQAYQSRAMVDVNRGLGLATNDRKTAEAELLAESGERSRLAESRKIGGDPFKVASEEQVAQAVERERMARQQLMEAIKREGEASKQATQLKLESARQELQSLEQRRDMYRQIAAEARGEQRSAGIKYGELNPEERAKVDEAKRAMDNGQKLTQEQRNLMREYGGRGVNRRFDEQALANAPDWVRKANEGEAKEAESRAKQLDVKIGAQHNVVVKLEGDLDKIADKVYSAVGQQVQDQLTQAMEQIAKATQEAAAKAVREVIDQFDSKNKQQSAGRQAAAR